MTRSTTSQAVQVPPGLLSQAGYVHGETEDEDGSGEDTETDGPRTGSSKGKQPQTLRY